MAKARTFSEVPGAQLPDRFYGFFGELTRKDPATKNGQLGAETEVGLVGKLLRLSNDGPGGQYRYGSFVVQVYLSDLKERPTLEIPPKKSWVLNDYMYAERFHRGEVKGPKPSFTQAEVTQLFEHEMGHYRIGRLIALDLYRTLCEHAESYSDAKETVVNDHFNKWVDDYRMVRSLIQYAYDIGTNGGRDKSNQSRWQNDIIGKAERMADPAANNPAYRHTPAFWPGLQYTLAAAPAGASAADQQLAGELMTVYGAGTTSEINRAQAEQYRNVYKNKYEGLKSRTPAAPVQTPHPAPAATVRPF